MDRQKYWMNPVFPTTLLQWYNNNFIQLLVENKITLITNCSTGELVFCLMATDVVGLCRKLFCKYKRKLTTELHFKETPLKQVTYYTLFSLDIWEPILTVEFSLKFVFWLSWKQFENTMSDHMTIHFSNDVQRYVALDLVGKRQY